MNEIELFDLLRYGERITLECKEARNALPKAFWETYSSFANTIGGTVLLGIKENFEESDFEHRFTVQGVAAPHKIITDLWNTINSDKVSANILTDSNVYTIKVNGLDVVVVEVPQAQYHQRPVFLNGNPMKGSYKRNHEGDYHATAEDVKAMLRDANDAGNDGTLLEGYGMDDIDPETLRAYRMEYELRNPDHVFNTLDNKQFLTQLGGYTRDRLTGKEGLTTAGLMMFGKGLPIRERFDNISMDYLDQTNLIGDSRWSDRLTYDGMWENNLYNFMRRVIPKLISDLKRPFRIEGMSRIDDTPLHMAIREAFTNLVIHSDYLITGVLKVVKTDYGFVFSNPGNLKLPVQMIYSGGNSKARNPRIQAMLRMIGLGDNIGSGFPKILSVWKDENWRKPDLSENIDLHIVELKLWMISLMPKECSDALYQLFGADYGTLSSNEQIILSTAYLEHEVSNNRLQTILDLHSTDIGKLLYNLVQKGMFISDSKGRWTTYTINSAYRVDDTQPQDADVQNNDNQKRFNSTDQVIYDYVKANGRITSIQVMEITKINTLSGATKALSRLTKLGLIEKVRDGKMFYYQLTERASNN